jgi:ferric-dicitrate binding protein FerR (iron transport regulator)
MTDYNDFDVEDFVHDDFFRQWVKHADPAAAAFFQGWLAANPDKGYAIAQARTIVEAIDFDEQLDESEKAIMWRRVQASIKQGEAPVIPLGAAGQPRRRWLWAAASVAGLLLLAGVSLFFSLRDHQVATGYGEIRKVELPDGSVITLNANSVVRYQSGWENKPKREIWLDGEAYFSVRHTRNHQPFVVHTPDLNVEVLGTEFNVFKRAGKTKVSLNSGKVRISLLAGGRPEVLMKPGELVEYVEKQKTYTRKNVNAEIHCAWTQSRLVFDDTPVTEVLQRLHDNYGWEVEVKDSAVFAEKLTGEIKTTDEATLVRALAKALETKMTLRDNKLTIEKPD